MKKKKEGSEGREERKQTYELNKREQKTEWKLIEKVKEERRRNRGARGEESGGGQISKYIDR